MALFRRKKEKDVKALAPAPMPPAKRREEDPPRGASALRHPRVTEKSALLSGRSVYVFEVERRATKRDVAAAVRSLYKVTPRQVRIVPVPKKRITLRGRAGITGGGKKAYVYLKEGEKIEFA